MPILFQAAAGNHRWWRRGDSGYGGGWCISSILPCSRWLVVCVYFVTINIIIIVIIICQDVTEIKRIVPKTSTATNNVALVLVVVRQDKTRQRWNRAQATGLNAPKINLTKNNLSALNVWNQSWKALHCQSLQHKLKCEIVVKLKQFTKISV